MWRELDDVNDFVSTQVLYQPTMSRMKDVDVSLETICPPSKKL